ncbi:rod shape-determining protein MreB [Gilvimarinus japonicus]|uniref:Rod shape-determining protein MreB n=1 Tax=Gilvimarinus japonicus TaxID=1796469 RepID=A0ABV7HPD9_9GAMM
MYDEEPLMAIKSDKKGQPIVVEIGSKVKTLGDLERDKVVNPFSHPRLLVHDFVVAEKIIQHAISQLHQSKWIAPSPRVIFQPMEKLEGGVTGIEERLYRELCLGAGAREVLLYIGDPLSMYNLDFDVFKREHS